MDFINDSVHNRSPHCTQVYTSVLLSLEIPRKSNYVKLVNGLIGYSPKHSCMKTILAILLWCILFVLCWPLALVMIFILPIVWLLLLPFRILGFSLEIVFKLVGAVLMFPFKVIKAI